MNKIFRIAARALALTFISFICACAQGAGTVGEREDKRLPDADDVTIARTWPLFGTRGNWAEPWDTTGPVVGRVSKGMTAKRLLLHGEWYEIELPGGLCGWVPQHVVAPSAMEVTTVKHDGIALADTSRKRSGAKGGVQIKAGEKVTQIARGMGWVKVRMSDGREGWVEPFRLDVEGALPVTATSAFWYGAFNTLDHLGDKNVWLAVLVFLIHWLVLPILPGVAAYVPYYPVVGRVTLFNNWIVKAGYTAFAFIVGFYFIVYFLPSVPPFEGGFTGGIIQLWSFLILIGVIVGMRKQISYDRCDKCRRIGAGEVVGSANGGTSKSVDTTKTTYGHADGHTSTETKETTTTSKTNWVQVKCRHCGHRWAVQETTSSRSTVVK